MSIDGYLYDLSNLFLMPVQAVVVLAFVYAVFSLGMFMVLSVQRTMGSRRLSDLGSSEEMAGIKGYSMLGLMAERPHISREDMEIAAHRELALLRVTTRVAPMLGLVATMIPMGPALKSLANGNVQGISENLIIAFTAVIFALLAASITFWIASVRRDWLVADIRFVEQWREARVEVVPAKGLPVIESQEKTCREEAVEEEIEPRVA
jgi:hypothetical protein